MRADGDDDKKPSHINHDVFRVDILDLAVSAGPGIVNQEFVEILHSVEYAPAEARHMFDGRKAENIRIIKRPGRQHVWHD
ncbi:putative phage repressor protein CI [Klebsiella pneumoniae]|uniref:Putative phage repressor protein CI n=1 Tax=Klebsiella pneumoniae TaxID=573 RepID=A0A4P0XWF5_KLEPN|nr:putative phage repressor protein CI [Klebsiella pneumoniae]